MRIIAGKFKGSVLYAPKDKNTRPLKDLARESIFNLLTHSNKLLLELDGSNVFDLYAGTGSFGLECLSRNAKLIYFVENRKSAYEILEKNIEKLKIKKNSKIFISNVFDLLNKQHALLPKFDLIFCDPPFKNKDIKELIDLIFNAKILKKNGIIVIHRNKTTKDQLPSYFNILDERVYGISKLIFGKLSS